MKYLGVIVNKQTLITAINKIIENAPEACCICGKETEDLTLVNCCDRWVCDDCLDGQVCKNCSDWCKNITNEEIEELSSKGTSCIDSALIGMDLIMMYQT